jgi:hypothetical protein
MSESNETFSLIALATCLLLSQAFFLYEVLPFVG